MRVRLDLPAGTGWNAWVDLPDVPRAGDFFTLNGIERTIRHVIWHHDEGGETWVQVMLKPNADDLNA